jgi:predicted transcriptional regulator
MQEPCREVNPFLPGRDTEELAEMMMVDEERIKESYEELIRRGIITREGKGLIRMVER